MSPSFFKKRLHVLNVMLSVASDNQSQASVGQPCVAGQGENYQVNISCLAYSAENVSFNHNHAGTHMHMTDCWPWH